MIYDLGSLIRRAYLYSRFSTFKSCWKASRPKCSLAEVDIHYGMYELVFHYS